MAMEGRGMTSDHKVGDGGCVESWVISCEWSVTGHLWEL